MLKEAGKGFAAAFTGYGRAATRSQVISARGQTADRALIHVDTELEAKDLLNNRMAYVAVS